MSIVQRLLQRPVVHPIAFRLVYGDTETVASGPVHSRAQSLVNHTGSKQFPPFESDFLLFRLHEVLLRCKQQDCMIQVQIPSAEVKIGLLVTRKKLLVSCLLVTSIKVSAHFPNTKILSLGVSLGRETINQRNTTQSIHTHIFYDSACIAVHKSRDHY
jgi:hypothetical protein